MSETPCFIVFSEDRPLNLGGESSPLKFRGYGLTGKLPCLAIKGAFQKMSHFQEPPEWWKSKGESDHFSGESDSRKI